jgi:hypothetical protein
MVLATPELWVRFPRGTSTQEKKENENVNRSGEECLLNYFNGNEIFSIGWQWIGLHIVLVCLLVCLVFVLRGSFFGQGLYIFPLATYLSFIQNTEFHPS